jgi:release factor glutamine methyltransferase
VTAKPQTVRGAMRIARQRLRAAGFEAAEQEVRILAEEAFGLATAQIITAGEEAADPAALHRLEHMIERRLAHEPVYRIIGRREFYGLELELSPKTLEPRPDTETLVDAVRETVLKICRERGACRILDLGTGTGAIALALLSLAEEAEAVATDIAPGALVMARRNAASLGLSKRLHTIESDWFSNVTGRFDVIVSNPPYIRRTVIRTLAPEVRLFDPARALDGGEDGLDAYRRIAEGAAPHLAGDGIVAVEIGFDQKIDVQDVFGSNGFEIVGHALDLAGRDRVLLFRLGRDRQESRP